MFIYGLDTLPTIIVKIYAWVQVGSFLLGMISLPVLLYYLLKKWRN